MRAGRDSHRASCVPICALAAALHQETPFCARACIMDAQAHIRSHLGGRKLEGLLVARLGTLELKVGETACGLRAVALRVAGAFHVRVSRHQRRQLLIGQPHLILRRRVLSHSVLDHHRDLTQPPRRPGCPSTAPVGRLCWSFALVGSIGGLRFAHRWGHAEPGRGALLEIARRDALSRRQRAPPPSQRRQRQL